MAVDQGNDVWVLEALENIDFGGKVVLQLLVELREVDGLDGDEGLGSLVNGGYSLAQTSRTKKPAQRRTEKAQGETCMTHIMHTLIDRCEAPTADLLEASIATDSHPGVRGIS
jgi:hypothetical protein